MCLLSIKSFTYNHKLKHVFVTKIEKTYIMVCVLVNSYLHQSFTFRYKMIMNTVFPSSHKCLILCTIAPAKETLDEN